MAAETVRRRRQDVFEEQRFLGTLLIAPAVIFIIVLVGAPLVLAIYLSLTDATAGSLTGEFVGFRNYLDAWESENFRRALRNTVLFTFCLKRSRSKIVLAPRVSFWLKNGSHRMPALIVTRLVARHVSCA